MNPNQGEFTNPLNEIGMQQSSLLKTENNFTFRDLNKNGKLDIYEDPRQPTEARIEDLLAQMTLEEKAGMLFINGAVINEDGSIEEKPGAPGFGRSLATKPTSPSNHGSTSAMYDWSPLVADVRNWSSVSSSFVSSGTSLDPAAVTLH